jgi:signal transduction histidine kinase/ActR/RegA family two-component response regulator
MPPSEPTKPAPALPEPDVTAPRGRDHPIEIRTRIELVRIAYSALGVGTWISLGTAAAFALVVWNSVPSMRLVGWLGYMLVTLGWRFWLAHQFRSVAAGDAEGEQSPWGLRYLISTSLTAAGWGATAWMFPVLHDPGLLRMAHVLLVTGLATASLRMLLPLRKGSIIYVVLMVAPMAVRYFVDADWPGLVLGGCIVYFMCYTIWATRHNHRTLSNALVARFEREALAIELQAENARRDSREAELQEARERAESASRAKGEFLATISHEIRTPMNGVLGMLRVVRDTQLSPEQRSYLKTASDSAESLLLLLNDVLDFSKIEAGRLEIESAPFPPGTTARAVGDLMLARARDKGLQFDLKIGENLPGAIIGDATRLRQILVNLCSNAIKFTEKGRVELNVQCIERGPQKAVMQFAVTDTGIGIDSAALEKLFRPFTQADTSMSRRYGGTGLGLAISMRLAQAMGGAIQVQSAINQGSTFRLLLPCKLPEMTAANTPTEAPRFVTPTLSGRVLVVEDDSVNRQVIDLFLKKMSITPTFAPDGEIAISTATSETFDVVLMDCQLPGIDGMEATRQIRQNLGGKPLKIIALTANASTHVREACLAAGMDDFLSKPVRFELLAEVLSRNLATAAAK